jgi:hypothetical protein
MLRVRYMARMGEIISQRNALVVNAMAMYYWEDNIKMDVRYVG